MNISFNNELIEKQEYLQNLKEQFLEIYQELEDLNKENISIYNLYNYTFGKVYYKRYDLFCLCERAKRKIELYQMYLNKEEIINDQEVENTLDQEFKEYIRKLNTILIEYKSSIEFNKLPSLTEYEISEIKRIYFKIAKAIHPDVSINFNDVKKDLWYKTLNAYKRNDLETLLDCEILLENIENKIINSKDNNLEIINQEINKYQNKIEEYQDKINLLVNSFPYNQKDLLENNTLTEEKINEAQNDIILFEDRLEKLYLKIEELNPVFEKNLC